MSKKRPTKEERRATINSFLLAIDEPNIVWADEMQPKSPNPPPVSAGPTAADQPDTPARLVDI